MLSALAALKETALPHAKAGAARFTCCGGARDGRGRDPMRRSAARWRTPFGRWVQTVGVSQLTHQLCSAGQPVTQKAVYNWLAGERVPRPDRATAMARISEGDITLEDVYQHRSLVRTVQGS